MIDVLRSRRRTVTAILGVLLAVTFIAGTFIAIDSSTRATLDGLLANVPADIAFQAPTGNATQIRLAVEAVPGVVRVATSTYLSISEIESTAISGSVSVQVLGVEPSHLPKTLGSITVTAGSLSLPRGAVALEESLAARLQVAVGGTASFLYTSFVDPYNQTVTSTNVTVAALFHRDSLESGPIYFSALALVHIQDVDWYHEQLAIPYSNLIVGEVNVDRERFLDPYDLDRSQANLARLDRQIDEVLIPFGGSVTYDYIRAALSNFGSVIIFQRILYLALSTPVLLLGVYLGAIGVDLGHAERRRELAVMKTRGATRRQLVGLLLVEAALGGAIAAVAGLLAGVGLSRLLLNFVSPFGPSGGARYELVVLSPSTVATVVVLAVSFMAMTSFRSARRTANLPIVETLRYYAPGETKIHYKPTIDVLLVALAIATYGMVLYSQSRPPDLLTFLLGTIFFVLLPFTPVFLIVGTTRLLTRSTGRVYEWTARAAKPFAKNLYYVISRNLQRNPRRSANVAVIIALGIAFGIFILVTFSSQLVYQERQVRASIGADIGIDATPLDPTFEANLSALPDVALTSRIRTVSVQPPYCCASVYALDPDTYFAVTQPESWYFRNGGVDAARGVLATSGQILVTESYLQMAFLEVGDRIRLVGGMYNDTGAYVGEVTVNTTIGGIVRGLPGMPSYYGFGTPTAIYGSAETMGPLLSGQPYPSFGPERYLVDLRPGADWQNAKAAIENLGASSVQVTEEQIMQLRTNPVFRALFGFMELEMAFMVVILTAGLGVILYAATLERDVELAAIRARGASGRQTAGLLIGEASSIMWIGLIVGAGIGTLAAFLSLTIVAAGPGGGSANLIPLPFIIPLEALLLLALAPLAIIVTSFLVSYRVVRMDIARVLKLRGG